MGTPRGRLEALQSSGQAGATTGVSASEVEGVADDALDAFARVDILLDGDLVGGVLLEETANADVETFGVFAEDHEVDFGEVAITERGETRMEEFGGAGVDVEVELETQAEEDVCSVLVGRDAGIAEGAKEDGVELVAKEFDRAFGEGDVFAEVFVGAPVELDEFEGAVAPGGGGADDLDGYGGHFPADAVARNNGDAGFGTAVAKRDVGHVLTPVCEVGAKLAQARRDGRGDKTVIGEQISAIGKLRAKLTQRSQKKQSSQRRRRRQRDPSTTQPDASNCGAKEKVGPLRSG